MTLSAILFDVDGTLAETEEQHLIAFNHIFKQYRLEWHWSLELYFDLLKVTGGKERIKYYLTKHCSLEQPFPENITDKDAFIARLHTDKTNYYASLMAQNTMPLRIGVKRLIQEAREQGVRLAIVTTTSMSNVELLLKYSLDKDALSWFEVFSTGESVKNKKPAPDVYYNALKCLDLPASSCIALEDSYNGLMSAKNAGINTVIVTNSFTAHENFDGAKLVVDQFGAKNKPSHIIQGTMGQHQYINLEVLRNINETAY